MQERVEFENGTEVSIWFQNEMTLVSATDMIPDFAKLLGMILII